MQLFVDIIRSYTDVVLFFIVWLGIGLIYVLRQKRKLEREIQRRKDVEEAELERESRGRLTGLDVMVSTPADDSASPSFASVPPLHSRGGEGPPVTAQAFVPPSPRSSLPSPPPAPEPRPRAAAVVDTGADQEAQALLTQYTSGDGGGVEEMERMLERDPNNLQLLDWLAFMYYSNNDAVKAIATYQRIIEIEPNNASQHYYLGNCFFKNNEIERAVEEWNLVVQLKPGSKYARKAQERMTKLGTMTQ